MANYEPRHVYVVSFDTANTDLYYFCSHSDIVLDGVADANIFRGVLVSPSTRSQTLNPIRANATIGNISFSFIDSSQDLTSLLNSKLTGSPQQGLRAKRVQHWVGEKGAEWSSGYTLLQTQQFYNSIGWQNNAYVFNAQDIQRSELKDIFDTKKTTLTSTLDLKTTTINVNSSSDFSLVNHGGGYSDAPNKSVLYLQIQDEIIRCTAKPTSTSFTIDNASSTLSAAASVNDSVLSITDHSSFDSSGVGYVTSGSPEVSYVVRWTGKTDSPQQLTGVTGVTAALDSGSSIVALNGRGALGTRAIEHTVDTSQSVDKRTKVEEHIYLEMPAVQMLYALLTGTVYGASPATTLPSHWNLGIDASQWVATSEFLGIGSDLWDTSDDTAGFPLRFEGLKKTNAKSFIEKEILFICGLYTPILPTGELGLRRMSGVVSDSSYSRILDESNIISISGIHYDLDDIHNDFLIKWNYDAVAEEYTRNVILTDTGSINKWGQARQLEIKSLGLKGSSHTDSIIGNLFNTWRDRYSGPPFKATLQLSYSERDIRIGDIVRLQISNIPEFTDQNSAYGSLDISCEVQRIGINYTSGVVTVDVFGSTQRSGPLVIGNPSLDDTFYTSQGSDMAAMVAASPQTLTGTDVAGTLTITGNSTLTGVSDLNSATATTDNNQGIFYYSGDVTIDSGVTVTITDNVEIRCAGTFTNNGTIDGSGQGIPGTATDSGTAGYIGTTKATGGIDYSNGYEIINGAVPEEQFSTDQSTTSGSVSTAGPFNIVNNDTSISGKPSDLRGTSGGKGGDIVLAGGSTTSGANGGAGGSGLLIICRGAVGGASSSIDLSGANGTQGTAVATPELTYIGGYYSGSGAGGYPGALVVVLDGNTVTETITPYFTASLGNSDLLGERLTNDASINAYLFPNTYYRSIYNGFQSESKSISNLYVHYLTESQTAAADTPSESTLPTAITVNEHTSTQNAVNVLGLEISATAPSDTNYKSARIYIKKQSTEGWHFVGEVASGQEVVFWVASDGSTYNIKAHSVSITNVESDDYIERTYTVPNGIETQIGTGSTVVSGNSVASNGGLLISGSDLIVYDSNGNAAQTIDLSGTGNLTGIGTMSGSAADEQLVPNNAFNFFSGSPATPEGWHISNGSSSPFPSVTAKVMQDSPATEGYYMRLPHNSSGYTYSSKTFKLVPGKKYRVRARMRKVSQGSPDVGGVHLMIFYATTFAEPMIFSDNVEHFEYLAENTDVTTSFTTYEYDLTSNSSYYWGCVSIANWTESNIDLDIAYVEVVPWGIISDTDIGIFINDTTFANQGIQLDYNSGTPRMYVGDGSNKFLKFDGTDLSIGDGGSLDGGVDYNNSTQLFHIPYFQALDGFSTSTGFGGTVDTNFGRARVNVGTSGSSNASISMWSVDTSINQLSDWTVSRKFKTRITLFNPSIDSPESLQGGVATGGEVNQAGHHYVGFIYDSGQWKAVNRGSSGEDSTNITASSGDLFEAIYDVSTSPIECRFYVNDSLVATHTSNMPSSSTYSIRVFTLVADRTGGSSGTSRIAIGEFMCLVNF